MALIQAGPTNQELSEIMFVLILMEVYRLMIFYLREHRISVALTVEVVLVSTLREVMLKGAHEFGIASPLGAQPLDGRPGRTLGDGTLDGALAE